MNKEGCHAFLLARIANIMGINMPGVAVNPAGGRDYEWERFEQQMIDYSNLLVTKEKLSDAVADGIAAMVGLAKK